MKGEDKDTAIRDKSAEVRNAWEVGHWTPDRLIANTAANSVASPSTRAPRRRKTRYNKKNTTMTKTKKTLSVLETVHQRADCSKYANALGTDDNDVPSVTSSTIVSHVSSVCSVFMECAKCMSQAVARGMVDGIRTKLSYILQG